ncbi:MAG: pirin family protein [Phyllobacteriaceae bacterium]|nr:pirin family protein [Phyllobacteriaceae bacterium]
MTSPHDPAPLPAVDKVVLPRLHDLGDGFTVRRALPTVERRSVGPFVFLDAMGPVDFRPGGGQDVRPHPHIGLSTLTWLHQGEIRHRDSTGAVEVIRPGAVNWMTAGRGIVHSERTPIESRPNGGRLAGLQLWIALPKEKEEIEPVFTHVEAGALPRFEGEGATATLVAGTAFGATSPVPVVSDLVQLDVMLEPGARFRLPGDFSERALWISSGELAIDGEDAPHGPDRLVLLRPGAEIVVRAIGPTRFALVGGEPFPERRFLYWNFVSSSKDRIEAAKADWRAGRFAGVPGETEFIPLPPDPPGVTWKG